jgi:hypothetical protein
MHLGLGLRFRFGSGVVSGSQQGGIIFFSEKSVRLPDTCRSYRRVGQLDPFAEEVVIDLRVGADVADVGIQVSHPGCVISEEVAYLVVQHPRQLLHGPSCSDGWVII